MMSLFRLIPLSVATALTLTSQAADLAIDFDQDVANYVAKAFVAKPDGSILNKEFSHKKDRILIKDAGSDPLWVLLEEGTASSYDTDYLAAYKIDPKNGPQIHLKYPRNGWEIQSLKYGEGASQQLIKVERMDGGKPVPAYQSWIYYSPADASARVIGTNLIPGEYRFTAWVLPKGSATKGKETGRCLFTVPAEPSASGKIELKDEKSGEVTGILSLLTPQVPENK